MSTLRIASIDPCQCPVCGQPNQCAMEAAKTSGSNAPACWCVTATFSAELLARVPQPAQGKACICQSCAASHPSSQSARHV